jgi:hypothetical protein
MEHLERHIYNSVEGCAVAMAPSPKVGSLIELGCFFDPVQPNLLDFR